MKEKLKILIANDDGIRSDATEKKQGIGRGVQFKLLLYNRCQTVNSSAQIGKTSG